MWLPLIVWLGSTAIQASPLPTWDESIEDATTPVSRPVTLVQQRKYRLQHELALMLGSFPTDPYYKGFSQAASYTWNFSRWFGWQVVKVMSLRNTDAQLKRAIVAFEPSLDPDEAFPQITRVIASHLRVSPFYGKVSVLNRFVVHGGAYFQLGGAVVDRSHPVEYRVAGLDAGVGGRVWLARAVSVCVEVSELVYRAEGKLQGDLRMEGGLAVSLGSQDP